MRSSADPRADAVAVALDALEADVQRAGRRADLVEEQPGRTVVVGDDDVDVAIVVDVPKGGSPGDLHELERRSGFASNLVKTAVAAASEKLVPLLKRIGPISQGLDVAHRAIDDEQVQPPVVVVVEPPGSESGVADARRTQT